MARILTGKTILRGDENWKYGRGSSNELALLPDGVGYVDQTELTALGADGEVLYSRNFEGQLSSPASAPDGTLYVHDRQQLYAVGPDGQTRWSRPVESEVDPASGPGGEVYVLESGGRLQGLSHQGETRFARRLKMFWQRRNFVEPRVSPEGNVLVADRDRRVRAFRGDGSELWSYRLPESGLAHGPVWGPDGGAAFTTMDNEVVQLDPRGRERLRLKLENELTCAPLIASDGSLTVGDYFGTLFRIQDGEAHPVAHFSSAPTDQALDPDGKLMVSTRWGGVHKLGSWSEQVGGLGGPALASPDGIVYVNSAQGGLNALRTHRDPEAARAEEKRRARETFQAGQEPVQSAQIAEQDGFLLVGGIRVPRRQG